MLINLAGFAFCAAIIFFAGKRLSQYGDLLADLTGMGKAWVGLILMAAVTSLPELVVGASSSAIVQSADLAVGDILGSCAFNLGILSFMDLFTPKNRPLFSHVSQSHILAAAFGIILVSFAGLGIFLDQDIVLLPSIGLTSIFFAIIYFFSMKTIYRYKIRMPSEEIIDRTETSSLTLRQVIKRYILFAVIIISAALALPYFAEEIALATGLGESFVGTLFLAISTSLPEIAVSYSAIKIGAPDMAVGNLLGSNIFNIFILFLDDLFYTKGLLLKDANDANLISVFTVIMMSAIAIIGLLFPSKEKKSLMAWDTFLILTLYVLNIILLYRLT